MLALPNRILNNTISKGQLNTKKQQAKAKADPSSGDPSVIIFYLEVKTLKLFLFLMFIVV